MGKLVDAPDLGSGVLVRESSSLSNPTNILAGCRNGNGPDLKSEASFGMSGFDSYFRRFKDVQISPQVTRDRNPYLCMGDRQVIGN